MKFQPCTLEKQHRSAKLPQSVFSNMYDLFSSPSQQRNNLPSCIYQKRSHLSYGKWTVKDVKQPTTASLVLVFCTARTLEMAEQIRFFFQFWKKRKKLLISDLVCQVSTRSEFLWSNYKTLKIGVYNGNADTTVTMVLQLHHYKKIGLDNIPCWNDCSSKWSCISINLS